MSTYAPEPAALDPRPLLPKAHPANADDAKTVVIKTGAWDADLFGCLDSWVNCCTVWWLPCVALAQISQRIGWASYWTVLQILLAIYAVEIVLASIVSVSVSGSLHDTDMEAQLRSLYEDHPKLFVTGSAVSLAGSACTFLGSFGGLVMVLITWSLRGRVRQLFGIPGDVFYDGIASVCCSPCTVAQMATHVKSYKKGSCDIGPVDTLPGFGPLPHHRYDPVAL
jgi:Cys-rich protein (TIGR01571 family)